MRVVHPASRGTASVSPAVESPARRHPDHISEYAPVNMLHMELSFHLLLETIPSIYASDMVSYVTLPDIIKDGVSTPYLMIEFLALAALHLSVIRPEQRDHYRHHAAQLQTFALSTFNGVSQQITRETCVPILLFAAATGLHMLCDTLVFRGNTFEGFLDRFVQSVQLHRGVCTIATGETWEMLRQSALNPLLMVEDKFPPLKASPGPVCRTLLERIEASGLDDSTITVYQQTIQALQAVMTSIDNGSSFQSNVEALITWTALIPSEYVELISLRKGEALVILAHYGALLHRQRDKWTFCDGGEYLVKCISEYLGSNWEEWLDWPRHALLSTCSGQ